MGGSCSGCNPATEITLAGGVYYLDWQFVAGLIATPWPLLVCDDAYFDAVAENTFSLTNADEDEFFYELGLRNDDIPLTLNGWPLDDFASVAAAFSVLWLIEQETEYTLKVERDSQVVTFYYELDIN